MADLEVVAVVGLPYEDAFADVPLPDRMINDPERMVAFLNRLPTKWSPPCRWRLVVDGDGETRLETRPVYAVIRDHPDKDDHE